MTDATATHIGGTFNAQTVSQALFIERPRDALWGRSRYIPIHPRDGATKNDSGGTFELQSTNRVYDMSQVKLVTSLRICNGKTQGPLTNGTVVSFYLAPFFIQYIFRFHFRYFL